MTERRIGFRLKKLLGLNSGQESPSPDHRPEQVQANRPADSVPALEGPLFVRYVPMTPLMLQRSGPLPELRTLAGETLQPRSFLQVPLSADVKAREIQIILDDLEVSEDDLLDALRDASQEWQFSGCSLAEVCSTLFDTLDRLAAAGSCRVIEALATSESDDFIRIDREDGIAQHALFDVAITDACKGNIAGVVVALKKGLNPGRSGAAGPFLHYPITVTAEGSVEARMEAISVILDHGADIEQRDKNGWTALHAACHAGELPMIRLLLDRGANANATDNKGWSAYHYLTFEQAEPELFQVIRSAGADPDIQSTAEGNTALMLAVDRSDTRRVQILLANGANPGIARHDGLTALHMVAVKQNAEIVRLLLEAGAPVNQKGGAPGAPPLHQAAACGDAEMVRMLLEHGADTALLDVNGHTAIEIADGNGHFEIARLFEDHHGDDVSVPPERAPFVMGSTGFDAPAEPAAVPRPQTEPEAEDPFVVERMALLREQAPNIAKALDDLEQKLTENPEDVASWKLRGILLQQIGLSDKALACFNKVVELNEDDADAFVYSGQIVLSSSANARTDDDRSGLLDIARGAFTTALSKDPGHVEAAIGLGVYCITIGHPDEAHTWLDRALQNDPNSGKAYYMKGLALNSSGRAEEAQAYLDKAQALGFQSS